MEYQSDALLMIRPAGSLTWDRYEFAVVTFTVYSTSLFSVYHTNSSWYGFVNNPCKFIQAIA
jgi:hypothetical protein